VPLKVSVIGAGYMGLVAAGEKDGEKARVCMRGVDVST